MFCRYGNNNAHYLPTMLNMICVGVLLWSHEMSDEALTVISDCSGDEELSLPWQQKHWNLFVVVCLCLVMSHYSLGYNQLTGTGARVLATALQHNKSLEELK